MAAGYERGVVPGSARCSRYSEEWVWNNSTASVVSGRQAPGPATLLNPLLPDVGIVARTGVGIAAAEYHQLAPDYRRPRHVDAGRQIGSRRPCVGHYVVVPRRGDYGVVGIASSCHVQMTVDHPGARTSEASRRRYAETGDQGLGDRILDPRSGREAPGPRCRLNYE